MGKMPTVTELDAAAVKKIWEFTQAPIQSDLDFLERMTLADRVWDATYHREKRRFIDIERREERIAAMDEAIERSPERNFEILKHLEFEKRELERRIAAIGPVDEALDSIARAMRCIEAMAERDLGYIPHDFFGD